MNEVECVRFDVKQDEYFKKLLKEAGLELSFKEWNVSASHPQSPLIITLDQDHLEDCLKLLQKRDLKVIIAVNARRDFKLINDLKSEIDKIFGFLDLTQEINYNIPLIKNYINMNFSKHAIQLDKLAGDLDKVMEFTRSELTRIKDLHDRLVKVRVDNLKGVTVTSKFMAGERSGGEFFDLSQTDQQILFLMAGTNSYVLSSMILAEMEILKMSTPTTSLKSQCEHFEKMITHHASENNAKLNYCLLNIDLKNLTAEFKFQGQGNIYFNQELHDFSAPLKIKLKPGEKIHLLSQGALTNLSELNAKMTPKKFFTDNLEKNTKDLINEFFFEVSRNKPGNFLNTDAIMAVIEIEAKTLYKL